MTRGTALPSSTFLFNCCIFISRNPLMLRRMPCRPPSSAEGSSDLKQYNPMVSTGGGGLTRYNSASSFYFVVEYKYVSDFFRPPPPKPLSPHIDETAATPLEIQQPQHHVLVMGSASSCYTPSSALPPLHPLSRKPQERKCRPEHVVQKQSTGLDSLARHNTFAFWPLLHIDVHNACVRIRFLVIIYVSFLPVVDDAL